MSLAICHVGRSIISTINISCLFQTIRIAVIIPLPWNSTVTHFARQHNKRPHTLQCVTLPNRSLTNVPAMYCDTLQIHSHINAPLSKDNIHMHSYIMAWEQTALHCTFNLSERNLVNTSDLHTQSSLGHLKGLVHPKNENSVSDYSPLCRSNPVRLSFIFGT